MARPKALLISIDGLRGDFMDVYDDGVVGNLKKLAIRGCFTSNLMNQFCTLTLPNHVSMATGLYAENHGFVSNTMFDPEMEEFWTSWRYHHEPISDDHDNASKVRRWWESGLAYPGEPIWVTNQVAGGKSGIFEWPAACGLLCGHPVEKLVITSGQKSITDRINTILSWLDGPEDVACNFVAFYIPELDTTEHEHGPFGAETISVLKDIDSGIGYLVDELKRRNLHQQVNLIITSDHGHVEMDQARIVSLDRYVDKSLYIQKDLSFWPVGCSADELHAKLSTVPHCRVYWRHELAKMHYSQHRRIAPIIVVADPGAWLVRESGLTEKWQGRGNHGYDPLNCEAMRPPLICVGPAVRGPQRISSSVEQIDIYLLLCNLLGLRPAPNNGDIARISGFLAN